MSGLHDQVFGRIDRVAKALSAIQRATIQHTGLTPSQYQLLTELRSGEGRPPKDLAEACRCTRATITGVVDGLQRRGLVARAAHPTDRRSVLVQLTDAGRAVLTETPALGEVFGHCCSGLVDDELRALDGLLVKLEDSLRCAPMEGEDRCASS